MVSVYDIWNLFDSQVSIKYKGKIYEEDDKFIKNLMNKTVVKITVGDNYVLLNIE